MAINGRINVDALFHDTDGTTSLKVVSLEDSTEYTSGKVAIVTGTAGTAATTVYSIGPTTYRDASGQLVTFNTVTRAAFSWSNSESRYLESVVEEEPGQFDTWLLASKDNDVSVASFLFSPQSLVLKARPGNTGTYTIILYGT